MVLPERDELNVMTSSSALPFAWLTASGRLQGTVVSVGSQVVPPEAVVLTTKFAAEEAAGAASANAPATATAAVVLRALRDSRRFAASIRRSFSLRKDLSDILAPPGSTDEP